MDFVLVVSLHDINTEEFSGPEYVLFGALGTRYFYLLFQLRDCHRPTLCGCKGSKASLPSILEPV